ncbi:hypothetical protein FEM48_Zijuj05G0015800 [Ziziphus jujuba var. spinosa]|uniref:Large ribosomal subunit protein uL29m n=1 Tax=Ziziphus jujuba var. spinosa TaxID=714518 RepID=A0A978VC15_ZIZJJ|nr:hypothetical protein FEM48_Zijuj05G0015800 [Ziziphus jujuba var. spinosa]
MQKFDRETMFIPRYLSRTLFAAAKSETSAATTAASSSARTVYNPLEEFFEANRSPDEEKPVVYVFNENEWKTSVCCGPVNENESKNEILLGEEFCGKQRSKLEGFRIGQSWDDLNKLWYVLLKEKNMLMIQCQMLHAQTFRFPNPEGIPKMRNSMCRVKHVLIERAIEEPDPRRSAEMKRMINAL